MVQRTPPRGYDLETRIRDLLGLLDALGLDEVDLISHQWGAWTGFFACLEAPERFRHHLALLSSHERHSMSTAPCCSGPELPDQVNSFTDPSSHTTSPLYS
jgi:pimeloyl-ACP methyl ester carboxylesterase